MPFLSLLSVPVFLVQKTFVSQIAYRLFVIAYIGQPFVVGYLLYRHVAFFGGEAQPFSAGAPYAPLGQEGEVVICLPEAVELFVPAENPLHGCGQASVQGSGSGYIRIPGQPSATFAGRSCFLFAVSLFYQAGEVNIKIVFI